MAGWQQQLQNVGSATCQREPSAPFLIELRLGRVRSYSPTTVHLNPTSLCSPLFFCRCQKQKLVDDALASLWRARSTRIALPPFCSWDLVARPIQVVQAVQVVFAHPTSWTCSSLFALSFIIASALDRPTSIQSTPKPRNTDCAPSPRSTATSSASTPSSFGLFPAHHDPRCPRCQYCIEGNSTMRSETDQRLGVPRPRANLHD